MKKSQFHRGFTLTEILVVIAIIIALAAVGFSLMGKASAAAKAVTCVSNLRQATVPINIIREEGIHNDGKTLPGNFPPYAGWIGPPSEWRKFCIYELMGEKAELCEYEAKQYHWKIHPSKTFLQNPFSEFKIGGAGTEPKDIVLAEQEDARRGGFGYNHHINGWVTPKSEETDGHMKRTRVDQIDFPGNTIIMAEQSAEKPGMIIGPWKQSPWGTYKDGAHCLFVDGHVQHLGNEYLRGAEAAKKHFKLNAYP